MFDACTDRCRLRRPVVAGLAGNERAVGVRTGEDVVFYWRGRSGPLPVDSSPGFVDEERRVAGARVQLAEISGDKHAIGIAPRSDADSAPRINRRPAVGRI